MGKQNFSKIKLLKIWEMLKQYSDEQHPLTTNEILERLKAIGITCDRKTLYQDIATLNAYGYEVMQRRGQHNNFYYVEDRSFDVPELRILMDAVQAASFITEKKTKDFLDKISSLGGSNRAELLKKNTIAFNTTKHTNETIYYNIDCIDEGIINQKKISFLYFDYDVQGNRVYRKSGKRYMVNPIAMVFANDNYYLMCYHDNHDSVVKYRIDRMMDVILEDEAVNTKKIPQRFNLSDYRKQAFSMFGGEPTNVTFEASSDLVDVILDKFGEKILMIDLGNNKIQFTVEIQISNMFFGWCCSFGEKLKIVAPSEIRTQFMEYLQTLSKQY